MPPEPPRAVHEPVRVTAGASNQLLGDLHPDGRRLFFMTDQDATTQIYVKDVSRGGARPVWEADGDVSAPRVSPDGRRLLYVSRERDATGDACVMELDPDRDGGRRHWCVSGPDTAESQAFWFPDGRSVGALSREGVHGDLRLVRYATEGGAPAGESVLGRNLASPAVSPDGRWIAYVPVAREAEAVGVNFAMRAERGLRLLPVGGPEAPQTFEPALPGVSGFPAFSRDGAWLYFAQYLNDTNFDGRIDGQDNAVVFRTPFSSGAAEPLRAEAGRAPEQLTSAGWSCQYPAPAPDRLVITCARHGSLDVYTLPLAGATPRQWDAARLLAEVEVSRDPWERLLLLGRLLADQPEGPQRHATLRRMARLHLELREYESAAFYGRSLPPGHAEAVVLLAEHRGDERMLSRGQLSRRFVRAARRRLDGLEAAAAAGDVGVRALVTVVRAEILDVVGDEAGALLALEGLDPAAVDDPLTLSLLADRPVSMLRDLGLRDRRLALLAGLAAHPALSDDDRLKHAEAFIGELLSGAGRAARRERLAAARAAAPPDGELALLLDAHAVLQALPAADPEPVRAAYFEVYKRARELPRRRAVVMAMISAAARHDDPFLLYQFANSWVSWLRKAHPERKWGEALWREVALEEGYLELARGRERAAAARAAFFAVTLQTDSYEAHAGFVRARRAEGRDDVRKAYDDRYAQDLESPVRAYVLAHLDQAADPGEAQAEVRRALAAQPLSPEAHQLAGLIAHRRLLAAGDREAALEAYDHYELALDLARERPRIAARVDHMAGLLQAHVGNHRLALAHFDRRLRWPFPDVRTEVSLRMARARSLFMVDRDAEAAGEVGRCLALAEGGGDAAVFAPLVRDRAALYRFAAGDGEGALAALDALADPAGRAGPGEADNRLRRRLLRAAAALGAGRPDVAASAGAIGLLDGPLAMPGADRFGAGRDDLRLVAWGLHARGLAAAGRHAEADRAWAERAAGLSARLGERDGDELRLDLAVVSHRRALLSLEAGDATAALRHVEEGLHQADRYDAQTGSPFDPVGLRLVLLYAELHLFAGVPRSAYRRDLAATVRTAYKALCYRPSPRRSAERYVLGVYLTLVGGHE